MKIIFNQKDKRRNELKQAIAFYGSAIGFFALLIVSFIIIMRMLPQFV